MRLCRNSSSHFTARLTTDRRYVCSPNEDNGCLYVQPSFTKAIYWDGTCCPFHWSSSAIVMFMPKLKSFPQSKNALNSCLSFILKNHSYKTLISITCINYSHCLHTFFQNLIKGQNISDGDKVRTEETKLREN